MVLLSSGCQTESQLKSQNEYVKLTIVSIGNSTEEKYSVKSPDVSAFQVLDVKHEIKLHLGGNAIECIDGVCAESGYWWPMYVNGKMSTYGVNNYHVKGGEEIEFRFAKR